MAITLTLETTGSGSIRVLPHSMLHPGEEYKSSVRNSTPLDFWGRANSYTCPLGKEPGSAYLLMLRRHLNAFSKNSFHKLIWSDGGSTTLTIPSLVMVRSTCINRAISGELDAAHLVELRDKRHMFQNLTSIASQYNVRIPAPDCTASPEIYYEDSLNSASVWTWQTLLDDIWGNLPTTAGTAPTLPYSPDATPEGWRFIGLNAWDALHEVLQKIDCTTSYNPITDVFSYVQLGTTQSGLATAKTDLANVLLYDYDPGQDHQLADMPETVRVFFHRRDEYHGIEKDSPEVSNWEMLPYETKDTATGITGVLSGSVLPIWDDLPALYDGANTNTNCALLDTRAAEIAANVKNRIDVSGERWGRIYSGLRQTILPGSEITEVRWRDFGDDGGLVTEILQRPPKLIQASSGSEHISPPDLARASYPVYPRLSQMVQADDGAAGIGTDLTANGDGLYPGFVRRWADGAWSTLEACWIRPTDLELGDLPGTPPVEATVVTVRQKDSFIGRLAGVETSGAVALPVYLVRLGAEQSSTSMYDYDVSSDEGATVTIDAQDTLDFDASGLVHSTERNATKALRGIVQCVEDVGAGVKRLRTAVDKSVMQQVVLTGNLTNSATVLGRDGTVNAVTMCSSTSGTGSPICLTGAVGLVDVTPNNPFHSIKDSSAVTVDLDFEETLEFISSDASVTIDVTSAPPIITLDLKSVPAYDYGVTSDTATGPLTIDDGDTLDFDATGCSHATEANGTQNLRGIVQCVVTDGVDATIKHVCTAVDKTVMQQIVLTGDLTNSATVLGIEGTRNAVTFCVCANQGSPVCMTGALGVITINPNNPFHTIKDNAAVTADLDFKDTLEFTTDAGSIDVTKVSTTTTVALTGMGSSDWVVCAEATGPFTMADGDTLHHIGTGAVHSTEANSTIGLRGIVTVVAENGGDATIKCVAHSIDKSVLQQIILQGDLTNSCTVLGRTGTRNAVVFCSCTSGASSPICLTGSGGVIDITPNDPFHTIKDNAAVTADLDFEDTLEFTTDSGSIDVTKATTTTTVAFTGVGALGRGAIIMGYKAPIVDTGKSYMDDGSGGASAGAADTNWALMDGSSNITPGSGISLCELSTGGGYFVRGMSAATTCAGNTAYGRPDPGDAGDDDLVTLSIATHPDHVHILSMDGCADTDGDNVNCAFTPPPTVHKTGIQKTNAASPLSLDLDHTPVFANNDATNDDDFNVVPTHKKLWFFEKVT